MHARMRGLTPHGFTLVELMVVLAIIGIALVLSMPSWDSSVNKRRVTAAGEQLASSLSIAQTESIKRNQPFSVSFTRNSAVDWCVGSALGDAGCDCEETDPLAAAYCAIDGAPARWTNDDFPLVQMLLAEDQLPGSGDARIVFDPVRGILEPVGDRLSLRLLSGNGEFALEVRVAPTGLLRICNPDTDLATPGFSSCV